MTEEEREEFDLWKADVRTSAILIRVLYQLLSEDAAIRKTLVARLQMLFDMSDPQIEHLSKDGLEVYELRLKEMIKLVAGPS